MTPLIDKRHYCPPWCHSCPEIEAIVRANGDEPGPLDIMPWCQSGMDFGLEACCCSHDDPLLDANAVARANWFAAERIRSARRLAIPPDELGAKRAKRRAR